MKDMLLCKDRAIKILNVEDKTTKLDKHKSYGYVFRITKKAGNKALKKAKNKYQTVATQKSAIYFNNLELRKLSKEYKEFEKKYFDRQKIIVNKTVEITKTYIPVINEAISVFSELDVILSLAHVADTNYAGNGYILPKIYDKKKYGNNKLIKMKGARHPCLELIKDDQGGVIPNDVELINNKSTFQIVTGPNMGGKSTYIRTIGLIVLMAQIGSYVPCDECQLTIIDAILCRIGASDNQLRGISTFMAEMVETTSILEAATSNSLIIIDELGRGTSTYDGYGIAYSISEHIITKLNSFTLFATHFHELSTLALQHKSVQNKHVTAIVDDDDDTLTMLYKIENGPCPQSFGIEVAKLAKFPQSVIQTAQRKAAELESIGKCSISLLSYNSIQKVLKQYKILKENVISKNWNQDNQEYKKQFEELKKFILNEMDDNKELDEMALKIQQNMENDEDDDDDEDEDEDDDMNNNIIKGSDKMEVE